MYSLVLVLLVHVSFLSANVAENYRYENRLSAFPPPDFNTSFILRSRKGAKSFREIRHGLGVEPFYVRVYATPKSGPNKGYVFEGVGGNHVDSRYTSYGGIIFAYNSEYIRIWAPNDPTGYIIFVKDGWGNENHVQQTSKAVVFVQIWKTGPEPNFQLDTVIGNGTRDGSFKEIKHLLRQIPERVLVRVSPENPISSDRNPNGGFWFHATGSSQNSYQNSTFGGVIFAYNEHTVRLWAPDKNLKSTGCILIDSAWGDGKYNQRESRCRVHVKIWINIFPIPSFQTDWFNLQAQTISHSFKTISHNLNILPEYVLVQTRPSTGMNYLFVFEAQGSVQTDNNSNDYGGIIFAYDKNNIRLWAPVKNDGTKKGYTVLVKDGWGDNRFLQSGDTNIDIRVKIYTSKCKNNSEVCFPRNSCIGRNYESYIWVTSSWAKCSSICNKGQKERKNTGCFVKSKGKIKSGSCNFEKDICQWTTTPLTSLQMTWLRSNTSTPTPNTGPLWGYPKGSYYIYTHSDQVVPSGYADLTSPDIQGARKCHLTFFWNMYGEDIGELKVQVQTDWSNSEKGWKDTGWSMRGSQGPNYWRSAYVNLEQFDKIYHVRFRHILPKRPEYCKKSCFECKECKVCLGGVCTYANVAIDDVELWCEASYNITSNEQCKDRIGRQAGCDQSTVIQSSLAHLRGPAYGEQIVRYHRKGLRTFVFTSGSKNDLVAKYFINIDYEADYCLWMSVFSTNETNNRIAFQVDEGDWHTINTVMKRMHHLWLNYRHKTFFLKPGTHSVTFRQVSLHFRFDKVALAPVKLSNWVDLGMQSYHIPDSYLKAYPPRGSRPGPKHGRLNDKEAWCSTDHNKNFHYFEIKLPNLAILSRIAVQGAKNLEQKSNNYWTKSFKLRVSIDDARLEHFTWYRNRSVEMKFTANSDSSSIVETELPFAVPVRAVRLYPQEFFSWVCLRVELYGIYLSSAVCAASGPELPLTKPCVGDRDCGDNADCQKANSTSGIRKTIGDLWQKIFPSVSNNSSPEYCTCYKGHHGASCEHYGCKPNPCHNNGKCTQNSFNGSYICTCLPGYYGNHCQMSCQTGYYGYNCSQMCKCSEHSSCDKVTGQCNCYPGFMGKLCDTKCKQGYYGDNCAQKCQCQNGATCDHVGGLCNCTVGWMGQFCEKQCPWNMWGVKCRENCSCSSTALECNRRTGQCICGDGYYGKYCEKKCPVGTYGWNCTQTCRCAKNDQCSVKDGTCNCTLPGMTGLLCNKPCTYGLYGLNCEKKCTCMNGADCDSVTGKCACSSGWLGKSCDKRCPQDTWGLNCTQKCSCVHGAKCNPSTGQCVCTSKNECTCDAGWSGKDCTTPCSIDQWGINCLSTCNCKNNGLCNPETGKCKCLPGFSGMNCDSPCTSGYYGNNCSLTCSCNSSTSSHCIPGSGICVCLPGWKGVKCETPCSKGSWGPGCNQSCSCVHGSCHPITGHCTCDKGWRGDVCDKPCSKCGLPCPVCYHGYCNKSKGGCICNDGYTGSSCLESCPSGYYGRECLKKCTCTHGICRPDTGTCDCQPGWRGIKCDQACPQGRYGYKCSQQCNCVNGLCNAVNGSCTCNSGYYGYSCNRHCLPATYGSGCQSKCKCLNNGVCHHVTGQCLCKAGLTGSKCDARCKAGYYGMNCTARCSCKSCDPSTGLCHCPPGWQGLKCTHPCQAGFYGNNCSQICSCSNGGFCDHVDGTCACNPGWTGPLCKQHCPPGRFGMQCLSTCSCKASVTEVSRPCHHVTGVCNCRPGYHGLRCLDQCSTGLYGKNCTSKCSCLNDGICSFVDGSCMCQPGYYGQHCEKTCPAGRYGVNCNSTCKCVSDHTITCNRFDGFCSCKPGYLGAKCENRCPEGTFGAGCHGKCQCNNNAHCDHVSGVCMCPAGFKGKRCDQKCEGFMFGPFCKYKCLCENGAVCNPVTGSCICKPGYTGLQCSSACLEGRFGNNCSRICDCNPSNTKTCDHRDGTCDCMPGFTHRRCDKNCKDGLYGQDCKMSCPRCSRHTSGPCNKQHGSCMCTPGYHGYQCYDDCPLKFFGLQCKERCICRSNMMCNHVDGTCLGYQQGLFTVVVMETMDLFNDIDRKRDFKLGIEKLIFTYYDQIRDSNVSVASQIKEKDGSPSFDLNQLHPSNNKNNNSRQTSPKHDFVVRILDMKSVFITKTLQGTQLSCIVMDKLTVINASDVNDVLRLVPSYEISNAIAARYYTGELYVPPKMSSLPVHLPLIIGVSVGTVLICTILITFKVRYRYLKRANKSAKKVLKDPAEFELLPYVSQGTSHLLAFDNPYYDILAVMGIDDDIEEEYSNPLYDDVSLYSGDSYNSSTDESCHRDIAHMVVR